jgi:hypothetical protein
MTLLEGGAKMHVQIVQNQMDFTRLGVNLPGQKLHECHKIRLGPSARRCNFAVAGFGFHRDE